MATFFEKKFLYIPCPNFVALPWFNIKKLHNLCNLGMTKSEIIVLVRVIKNIESFIFNGNIDLWTNYFFNS